MIGEVEEHPGFIAMRAALARGGPAVSDRDLSALSGQLTEIPRADHEALGVRYETAVPAGVFVTDPQRAIGHVRINAIRGDDIVIVDNSADRAAMFVKLDLKGGRSCTFIGAALPGCDFLIIETVALRSPNQWLFWGDGATSVGTKLEIEGVGEGAMIGDDCMFASGIVLRNHDMHTIFDVDTGEIRNRAPATIDIPQHVWLGEGVMIVGAPAIGFGSVVGARSLVTPACVIPPMTVAAGTPARIVQQGQSWSREVRGVSNATRDRLRRLGALAAPS